MTTRPRWMLARGHLPHRPPPSLRQLTSRVCDAMDIGGHRTIRVSGPDGSSATWTSWGLCADCGQGPTDTRPAEQRIHKGRGSYWGTVWRETPIWGRCLRRPCNGRDQMVAAVLVSYCARLHGVEPPREIVRVTAGTWLWLRKELLSRGLLKKEEVI